MLIGGFQRTSLIDYPGKISAIVFTQGCNFRCPYCYNPELADPKQFKTPIKEEVIFNHLKRRKNLLEAVTVTGGEPTRQPDLSLFLKKLKKLGFLVKLDTNGTNPPLIKRLLEQKLIDYLAMDLKAPLEMYEKITRRKIDLEKIKESIKLIMNSSPDYEFRTTLTPSLHTKKDVRRMAQLIKGAKKYYLQNFISQTKILDEKLKGKKGFSQKEMKEMIQGTRRYVLDCQMR